MKHIDKFSLQSHDCEYGDRPLKSLLYYSGISLGIKVLGYVIEKQFELTDYFLLLISWDCPFEEGCEIVVLNKSKNIVGCYSFNAPYNSYNLIAIVELSSHRYKLTFNDLEYVELWINYPKKHLFSKVITVSTING